MLDYQSDEFVQIFPSYFCKMRRGDMLVPVKAKAISLNRHHDFIGVAYSIDRGIDPVSSQHVFEEHFPAILLDDWEESLWSTGLYVEGRRALLNDGRVVLLPRSVMVAVDVVCVIE